MARLGIGGQVRTGQIRAKVATYKKRYYTGLSPAAVRAATR